MIKVYIPTDKEFNYKECKQLYKKYRKKLRGSWTFREAIENSFFYSFFDDETFVGCAFYYKQNDRMNVGAYGTRGHHLANLQCLRMSLDWFNCDIYAESKEKPAILCLLRCGFKKISNNIYKYEREHKLW